MKEAERSFTELLHDSEVKANAKAEVEARLKDLEAMRNQAKAERAGVVSRLAALKAAMDKARERGQTAVAGAEQVEWKALGRVERAQHGRRCGGMVALPAMGTRCPVKGAAECARLSTRQAWRHLLCW